MKKALFKPSMKIDTRRFKYIQKASPKYKVTASKILVTLFETGRFRTI